MQITYLGYFCILLTIIFLVLKKDKYFLYSAIFFSGFSGSSVINVAAFSFQPSYYFFTIYFVLGFFLNRSIGLRIDLSLLIFVAYCCISIVFPLFLENKEIIIIDQDGFYTPLKFSFHNITQLIYLLFCVFFLNNILKYSNDIQVATGCIKSFKYGFYAVILICIYQMIAFYFSLPFDDFFRQGVHGNVQGTRIYGPCIEASMLCYYLVTAIIVVWQMREGIWDYLFMILSLWIGILSASSTYLVGLIFIILFILLYFLVNIDLKRNKNVFIVAAAIMGCAVVAVVVFFDNFYNIVSALLIKLRGENTSGIERWDGFITMLKVGLNYPFGVGFGSSRSKDLFSTWICNVGVVGLVIYFLFILRTLLGALPRKKLKYFFPYLLVVLLMMISVPEPYNIFIWFYLYYYTVFKNKEKEEILRCSAPSAVLKLSDLV